MEMEVNSFFSSFESIPRRNEVKLQQNYVSQTATVMILTNSFKNIDFNVVYTFNERGSEVPDSCVHVTSKERTTGTVLCFLRQYIFIRIY